MSNRNQRKQIKEFKELTQCNDATAKHYLKGSGWELQPAINSYYESGCQSFGQSQGAFDEEAAAAWFDQYREMGASQEQFGQNTIPRFCEDIGIDANDLVLFVFSWKCECEVFCRFTKKEFLQGLRHSDVRADSAEKLKTKLDGLRSQLEVESKFKDFFTWLFNYAKPPGQRGMGIDSACGIWPLFLSKGPFQFEYLPEWLEFVAASGKRQVNLDTWDQLLLFIQVVQADKSLAGYDENEAWPVLIDEFVSWLKDNNKVH